MVSALGPASVVQAQLDAYNAKDLARLLDTYADDAVQFALHGECLARGRDEMRARFAARFAEPDLHARLISRSVVGHIVIDVEIVTRNFAEGVGTIEIVCVYEVDRGRITKASFAYGEKRQPP